MYCTLACATKASSSHSNSQSDAPFLALKGRMLDTIINLQPSQLVGHICPYLYIRQADCRNPLTCSASVACRLLVGCWQTSWIASYQIEGRCHLLQEAPPQRVPLGCETTPSGCGASWRSIRQGLALLLHFCRLGSRPALQTVTSGCKPRNQDAKVFMDKEK